MLTKQDATNFIKQYAEVVLETPYGTIHICGSPELYKKLTEEKKAAFSPSEIVILSEKLKERKLLEPAIRLKINEPAAKLKGIITANGRVTEIIVETPAGSLHLCMSAETYNQRVNEGKAALNPNETDTILSSQPAADIETLTRVKTVFPGSKIKEVKHAAKPTP